MLKHIIIFVFLINVIVGWYTNRDGAAAVVTRILSTTVNCSTTLSGCLPLVVATNLGAFNLRMIAVPSSGSGETRFAGTSAPSFNPKCYKSVDEGSNWTTCADP